MKLIIHRGTHQIGGSCVEVMAGKTRIVVDAGLPLLSLEDEAVFRESDFPNVEGLFTGENPSVDALLLSHYHGDHAGLLPKVHEKIPVYMGEATERIMEMTARFVGKERSAKAAGHFISGKEMYIGDFKVTPYLVDHSAYDAYAFVIEAGGKRIVYSGDLRLHGRKSKATWYFLKNVPHKVDALLLEGTMLGRRNESVLTETEVERQAAEFMGNEKKPILLMQSAANIDRLVGMYKAARSSEREFVMDIFTANMAAAAGGKIPNPFSHPGIRVFYPGRLTDRMFQGGQGEWMSRFSRFKILREELCEKSNYCLTVRGSMLNDLRKIGNLQGAGFIYSLWKGYLQTKRMQDFMRFAEEQHMKTVYLHTSGHADLRALKQIAAACTPRYLLPMHTTCPEEYAQEFQQVKLLQDGEAFELK